MIRLDYDRAISAPFKASTSAATPPIDLTPLFVNLAIARPLLLIRGAISDLLDAPLAQAMRALAPDMAYVEVPGIGHAPTLSEPAAWTALQTWLAAAP